MHHYQLFKVFFIKILNHFSLIGYHVLVGLPSGNLLLAGGYSAARSELFTSKIWLFADLVWTEIGELKHVI